MLRRLLLPLAGCLLTVPSANAQQSGAASGQSPPQPAAGQLLNEGFEVKAVINNILFNSSKG